MQEPFGSPGSGAAKAASVKHLHPERPEIVIEELVVDGGVKKRDRRRVEDIVVQQKLRKVPKSRRIMLNDPRGYANPVQLEIPYW